MENSQVHSLDDVLDGIWAILKEGVRSRHSEARTMAVAYQCDDDFDLSHVVLRGADRERGVIWFHTDARTQKGQHIASGSFVRSVIYCPQKKVQIRLYGRATIHHDDVRSCSIWEGMGNFPKKCYRQSITPGGEIERPGVMKLDSDKAGMDRFKIIELQIDKLSYLYLFHEYNVRAVFERVASSKDWQKKWLAP